MNDQSTNIFADLKWQHDIFAWSEDYGHKSRVDTCQRLAEKATNGTLKLESLRDEATHYELHGSVNGDKQHQALARALMILTMAAERDDLTELVRVMEQFEER